MLKDQTLIGSQALRLLFSDFHRPYESDWDWLVSDESKVSVTPLQEKRWHHNEPGLKALMEEYVPTAQQLLTLKMSHSFWDREHWAKTMDDINWLMCKGVTYDDELFEQLYGAWSRLKGPKVCYLKKSTQEFFEDAVPKVYNHDDLHAATSYYEEPLYTSLLDDPSKPYLPESKFLTLPYEDRLKLAREEIHVIALERFIIPHGTNLLAAYIAACRLTMTSLSKGWFAKFIVTNWPRLRRPDGFDFTGRFEQAVASGRLQKINYLVEEK